MTDPLDEGAIPSTSTSFLFMFGKQDIHDAGASRVRASGTKGKTDN